MKRGRGRKSFRKRVTRVGRSLTMQNQTMRVTARILSNSAISQTAGTVTISEANLVIANMGSRVVDFGDTFMYWRLTGVRAYAIIQPGAVSASFALHPSCYTFGLSFIPISNSDYTAPTSITQICDFPEFKQDNGGHKIVIFSNRKGCTGSQMTKWLTVNTQGSEPNSMTSAGTLTWVSVAGPLADATLAGNLRVITEVDVEFRTPIDAALIPMDKKKSQFTDLVPNRITEIDVEGNVKIVKDDVKFTGRKLPQLMWVNPEFKFDLSTDEDYVVEEKRAIPQRGASPSPSIRRFPQAKK